MKSGIYCIVCQGQAAGDVIEAMKVERVVHASQLAIGEKKSRVSRDGLGENLSGFSQKIPVPFLIWRVGCVSQRRRADVKVVSNKIVSRPLLDCSFLGS